MTNLLAEFEQQFATVTADITAKTCILSSKDVGERTHLIVEVEKLVEEAKELLERMDLEVRDSAPSVRDRQRSCLKSYQVELSRLEGEFLRTRKTLPREADMRDALLGTSAGLSSNQEQEQALLDNTQTLERTSERLTQGYKIALETEQVGALILNDLHGQRQTITKARERLRETDSELDQSSRILGTMMRRFLQNRFVLYIVVIFITIAILVTLYFVFRS